MLGMSAVAAVLAIVQAYPVLVAELITVNLLLAAPAILVLLVALWLSGNRRRSLVVIGTSIIIGWLISPYIYVSWSRPPTFWDRFRVDFYSIGMFMLAGAIVGTMLDFMITFAIFRTNAKNA